VLSGLTTSHYNGLQQYVIHLAGEAGGYPCSARVTHANADALGHNLVGSHDEDEDFGVEIQDEMKNVSVA
jgi:hypothetical protein